MGNLYRFKEAQAYDYEIALSEIKRGRKVGHWMWYIFPQLTGLGRSEMARYYGIANLQEAQEYMADAELRGNLLEICGALMDLETSDPVEVMGYIDGKKLCSCVTLFREAAPEEKVFSDVLDKFYGGRADPQTLRMLAGKGNLK